MFDLNVAKPSGVIKWGLTHTCPHKSLTKTEAAIDNHQVDSPFYLWPDVCSSVSKEKGMAIHDTECPYWNHLFIQQHKAHSSLLSLLYAFQGVINKQGANHIGILVHNCFNGSVPKDTIPAENIVLGQTVTFTVTKIYTSNRIMCFNGHLTDER